MHNDDEIIDLIDKIDALIGHGAGWTATGADHPLRSAPDSGSITAISLADDPGPVKISETDPRRDIKRLVGQPSLDALRHLRHVQLWVGDNSRVTHPVNEGATRFLHDLLVAIRDGHYAASAVERDHARVLLDHPANMPIVHGPCVITGVAPDGEPGPLDNALQDWITEQAARHARIKNVFRDLFSAADQISVVVYVLE